MIAMVNGKVDADPDRGSCGDDADDDPGGLALGYTDRATGLSFGWFREEQERNTEKKGSEFVAQG